MRRVPSASFGFGWKGGIGTSSRRVSGFTVGVLVQTNFGGKLTIAGVPVPRERSRPRRPRDEDGSCMIVIATDAPLLSRNLRRLGRRAFAGMARTGASFSNGSGDYAIAFSTAPALRRAPGAERVGAPVVVNAAMTPLFVAAADATEEAILNAMLAAETLTGINGYTVPALPQDRLRELISRANRGLEGS